MFRCEFSDGSGTINFSALGKANGNFRFSISSVYSYTDFWYYSYNPGVTINKTIGGLTYKDLTVNWEGF